MGNGLTADSYNGGVSGKSNGVFGQLKAFYEMNSIHKDGNSLSLTPVSRSIKASIHSTIHKVTTNGRRMIDGLDVSNKSVLESVAGGAHSEELKNVKKGAVISPNLSTKIKWRGSCCRHQPDNWDRWSRNSRWFHFRT